MNTLAEIEAAADALPPDEKEKLLRFLAEQLRSLRPAPPLPPRLNRSRRGFPISRGRAPFTSADVARFDLEAELQ